jgi:acetyl-CoA carboxylase biotin carboxyl carrier protein
MPNRFAPDAEMIRSLAAVIAETGLTEIEYADGDRRIRVARMPGPQNVVMHAPQAAAAPAGGQAATPASDAPPANAVVSPMVGTVYLAAEPGAAPFAKPGDRVNEGQTLLIIEAMKTMNQIHAPRAGKVTAIYVDNGHPVEYGEPLVAIE